MRHAGQLKAGYYPVPQEALELLLTRLETPVGKFTVLDPCAGKGAAVSFLGQELGCWQKHVHAIELDEGRAEDVKAELPEGQVLAPASALGCYASPGSFSLIWLNPPFDHGYESHRVEAEFLKHVRPWLCKKGIMVLCCPENVYTNTYGDLWAQFHLWFERVSVIPFGAEYRNFNEIMVVGVLRDKINVGSVKSVAGENYIYRIPESKPPKRFFKCSYTEGELQRALSDSPLRKLLKAPKEMKLKSPPLSLGTGHLALLLASGHIDGLVCPPGEEPHVVRGTSRKVEYEVSSTEEEGSDGKTKLTTIMSEKIQLIVRLVGTDGIIKTLSSGE